jgi:hypothetical protein
MARRFAGKDSQKQADLIQTAMEAVMKEGGTLDPRNAMRASKVSMLTAIRPEGGTGARTGLTQQISKIQGKLGELGDFRLRSELNKLRPKAEQLSLDQVRNARSKIGLRAHQRPGSLEDLENVARNTDNPETAAILQQGIDRLTPAQQLNLRKHMAGEAVNPQILKRIQDKFKGGKTTSAKPISGGSPSGLPGDDAIAGFEAHQFRPQLRAQPRQQFGQEGPLKNIDPALTKFSQEFNPQLTASSVWSDTAEHAAPVLFGNEQYSLGAAPVAEGWDRLRQVLSQLGKLQGRN